MKPEFIALQGENVDEAAAVRRVVDALRDGKLVVLPTETVYGLAALASNAAAVERLIAAKGRPAGRPLALAISGADVLERFAPNVPTLAKRLARRLWPGPLTLVLDASDPASELARLPEMSKKAILPEGKAGFRVPRNAFVLKVLETLGEPVVLTSANLSGEPPATSAADAKVGLDDRPDLIVDDGVAAFGEPSSVVEIVKNGKVDGDGAEGTAKILREGAISAEKLRDFSAKVVLFVCTGNTCRSPMAEVIAKKEVAARLGIDAQTPEELDAKLQERGIWIASAGVAAADFSPASSNAKTVVREDFGTSLDRHAAQSVTPSLVRVADLILTMGRSHRAALLAQYPEAAERVELLRPDGGDVADPFGGSVEVYRRCAREIAAAVRERLPEIM
ncbi:MAG: threonylcarbamoyl-AMP synthase [Thermoguttaceae bacterium]|nr:threonylcarbamoyl-AMP synthase [Thermoguttaceae bacterium]